PLRVELDLHLDRAPLSRQPPAAVGGRVELGLAPGVVAEVPDALADQGNPAPALLKRRVHRYVRREQPLRRGVVPGPEQLADLSASGQRLRPRAGPGNGHTVSLDGRP